MTQPDKPIRPIVRHEFSSTFFAGVAAACGIIVLLLAIGASYFVTQAEIDANKAANQQSSEQFEANLCKTLNSLKALKPPPGNPQTNPSRAFDVQQHAVLAQLSADLGCPAIPVTK